MKNIFTVLRDILKNVQPPVKAAQNHEQPAAGEQKKNSHAEIAKEDRMQAVQEKVKRTVTAPSHCFTIYDARIEFCDGWYLYIDQQGNVSPITQKCARAMEYDFYKEQAVQAYQRGGFEEEIAYCTYGFEKDVHGHWIRKSYAVDDLAAGQKVAEIPDVLVVPEHIGKYCISFICKKAFQGCNQIESVSFPDTISEIGTSAFQDTGLRQVTLPSNVRSVGMFAFIGCNQLNSITIPGDPEIKTLAITRDKNMQPLTIIGRPGSSVEKYFKENEGKFNLRWKEAEASENSSFESGNSEYAPEEDFEFVVSGGNTSIKKYKGKARSLTVPEELGGGKVRSIYEHAFRGCSGLEEITLPQGITSIREQAFSGCRNLRGITIPDSVTYIGNEAFYGCGSLTVITIPDSVTRIGDETFYGCSGLTRLDLPGGITYRGSEISDACWNRAPATKSDSIAWLRSRILYAVRRDNASGAYDLEKLLWKDAADAVKGYVPESCCPFDWDLAEFMLDLSSHKLSVYTSVYPPNERMSCPEKYTDLTPEQFHQIALNHLKPELRGFETATDWDAIFDDRLKDIISRHVKNSH